MLVLEMRRVSYFCAGKNFSIMYTLYAIPNCDTVKKARFWLAEHGIDYTFHDYKKQGIDRQTIERWLTQKTWEELVNRAGMTWKQLPDDNKPTNAEEAITLMIQKPSVIRRPLVEAADRIVALGFKAADYYETFSG